MFSKWKGNVEIRKNYNLNYRQEYSKISNTTTRDFIRQGLKIASASLYVS